jgi:hypothetical protein
MQLEVCIQDATKVAIKDKIYCPAAGRAKELLFKYGTITHRITKNGEFEKIHGETLPESVTPEA